MDLRSAAVLALQQPLSSPGGFQLEIMQVKKGGQCELQTACANLHECINTLVDAIVRIKAESLKETLFRLALC